MAIQVRRAACPDVWGPEASGHWSLCPDICTIMSGPGFAHASLSTLGTQDIKFGQQEPRTIIHMDKQNYSILGQSGLRTVGHSNVPVTIVAWYTHSVDRGGARCGLSLLRPHGYYTLHAATSPVPGDRSSGISLPKNFGGISCGLLHPQIKERGVGQRLPPKAGGGIIKPEQRGEIWTGLWNLSWRWGRI